MGAFATKSRGYSGPSFQDIAQNVTPLRVKIGHLFSNKDEAHQIGHCFDLCINRFERLEEYSASEISKRLKIYLHLLLSLSMR